MEAVAAAATAELDPGIEHAQPILLFDGECGLCARAVQFILRHERAPVLHFAPLQGETAAKLRARYPQIPRALSTLVLVEHGVVRVRSKGALYTSGYLRAPWRWGHAFRWMPAFLLDLGYRFIARIRYRVWGKADPSCQLGTPAQRARILA